MSMPVRTPSGPLCAVITLALTLSGGLCSPVFAANNPPAGASDLSPTPVDISVAVAPNVALTFDDSGSMSFGYMPDDANPLGSGLGSFKLDMCGWRYSDSNYNKIYFDPGVKYAPPVDADGNSFGDVNFNSAPLDGYSDALGFGSDKINLANAYAPTVEWDRDASHKDSVTSPACAIVKTSTSNNSTIRQTKSTSYNYYYKGGAYWTRGNSTPIYPVSASDKQNFANWYSYYRTRNLMTKTSVSRAFSKISSDVRVVWQTIWPKQHDIQVCDGRGRNCYSQTITRPWSVAIDPANSVIDALKIENTDPSTGVVTYDSSIKNSFYSWLQKIESSDGTPDRAAAVRVGEFFSKSITAANKLTTKNPYWNGKVAADGGTSLSCRKNFHILVTDGYWNEDDGDVSVTGGIVDSETATKLPVGSSAGRQFTPGTSNTYVYSKVSNGGSGINSKSLANIAFNYWAKDLQPGIADDVKPVWSVGGPDATGTVSTNVFFNPKNDPATWQHLSQYIVTLGVPGTLSYPGDTDALVAGTKSWPRATANDSSALDDMWHAAINSRGGYFSASNPQTLVDSLTSILNSVAQGNSTAVSGSLNTAVLVDGALTYSTGYDSTDWSGSVSASAVASGDGKIGGVLWDAKNKLPAADDRKIFTGAADATSHVVSGADFKWASLPAAQQTWLKTTPYTATLESDATLAQKRLSWLRGSQADEGTVTGKLRARTNLLGAVINSQAKYVAYPTDGYRNAFPKNADGSVAAENTAALEANGSHSYEQFVSDHLDRTPMVYVGANDGMLHAIDASVDSDTGVPTSTAGTEKWAYVPYSVYPNLSKLSSQDFTTKFAPTVDNSPVTRDVFFGGAWHTMLVAGLRYGGRGVYALDITSTDVGDTTAAKKVLWEFSSDSSGADATNLDKGNNPANLGYTYGQPNVARLSSGKWVVLVPSGYFPTCDKQFSPQPCVDAAAASNTRSSLFVLDAGTGALIKEIRTPAGVTSHGLTSPVVGDYNDDQVDDVAYAGDLDGNLWRFDLGNGSVTATDSSAGVLQLFKPKTLSAQPITVMPRLFPDPATNNLIVVFGTGKFLTAADNVTDSSTVTQSVYGIRDKAGADGTHTTTVVHADLVEQTLVETQVMDPDTHLVNYVRGLSNVAVPAAKGGWFFDLNVKDADGKVSARGEKVVVTPAALFDTNRAIISTLIPRGDDACDPRRDGALLVINAATGGSGDGLSYPSLGGSSWYGTAGANTKVSGARVKNPPTGGGLPVAAKVGGGSLLIPGVELGDGGTFKIDDAIWRRRSWRVLNND